MYRAVNAQFVASPLKQYHITRVWEPGSKNSPGPNRELWTKAWKRDLYLPAYFAMK